MNKDLIEFYEEERRRIVREILELNEVGRKSSKRVNRLVEIQYILEGLEATQTLQQLRKENWELKYRLQQEEIDLGE